MVYAITVYAIMVYVLPINGRFNNHSSIDFLTGTTCTGILAALSGDSFTNSLKIAFCHLLFNIFGILVWFPIPFMRRIPLGLAKHLGMTTGELVN